MNERQRQALVAFEKAIGELKASEVIRSDRYLGDIAEFLCADAFGIDLEKNLRQVGHDGLRENLKVQIKFGGGKKTNIDLGDPKNYDEIYVVLGKDSVVRTYNDSADFLVYRLTSDEVQAIGTTPGGIYSCGTSQFQRQPDKSISIKNVEIA